jgi:hypothetical protein
VARRSTSARARARRSQAAAARSAKVQARGKPAAAAPAARRPSAASRGTVVRTPQTQLAPNDAIVIYREAARHSWNMRLSLAVALVLLLATSTARDAGAPLPVEVGELGLGFMFLFLTVSGIKHYRALYRMRRGAVWSNSGRFMLLMAGAPFGAFDPEATRRDRILLRVIIVLAVLLLAASLAGGITRR